MSHPGKVRPNNEDHYMILRLRRSLSVLTTNLPEGEYAPRDDEDAYAMIVADGMGGAASGEVASRQAIRVGMELILRDIKWTMKFNEREEAELVEKLGMYFRLMDRALLESSRAEPRLAGMGTTLTAVCTAGPVAFVVHAGDSRAYLHRGGTLQRLTRDHTLAQDLVDSGKLPADSAAARRVGHVLTNYLGGPGGGGVARGRPARPGRRRPPPALHRRPDRPGRRRRDRPDPGRPPRARRRLPRPRRPGPGAGGPG